MRIAALILGIIGGIAGLVGATFAFAIGGLGSAFGAANSSTVLGGAIAALVFSIVGIVGGALSLKAPKVAGWLMLVAAVGGGISVFVAYAVAFPLLAVGGILALVSSRTPVAAQSVGMVLPGSGVSPSSRGRGPLIIGVVVAASAVLVLLGAYGFSAGSLHTSQTGGEAAASAAAPAPPSGTTTPSKPLNLPIGQSANYSGVSVTLVNAGVGPNDLSGKPTYKVSVEYKNSGTQSASFNQFDWKLEDSSGARTQSPAIIPNSPTTLSSGDIAPGGSTRGDIYFTPGASVAKVVYQSSIFSGEENLATWNVK